ncbi:MAG: 4-oxalocrotonate tautomerase [Thermincola sp.]|nr:4-oxalocrotonate tautomerase [Thermincola sp.]MDT3703796.1 4-oxalocrotonate tautomerase [Thermincola sp.]
MKEDENMPIVQIEILEGRTVEQKKAMVEKVTEAIIDSLGVSAESVSIIIRDMPRTDFAKGGKLAKEW